MESAQIMDAQITSLKDKGNEAFKKGNLDEALAHYTEAIKLNGDEKLKAIVLSNRAQTHLQLENYADALKDAEDSLKLDPSFKKSILRRANANVELDNFDEAIPDLRFILKSEPKNSMATKLMRRCIKPDKMNDHLRKAYTEQFMRRAARKACSSMGAMISPMFGARMINKETVKLLARQLFLSSSNTENVTRLLHGCYFKGDVSRGYYFILEGWFEIQAMRSGQYRTVIEFPISEQLSCLVMKLVRPGIVSFKVDEFFTSIQKDYVNKFDRIFYMSIGNMPHCEYRIEYAPECQQMIKKNIDIFTELPYLPLFSKTKNLKFANLKKLIFVPQYPTVDVEFLESWKKQKWSIKKVVFDVDPLDLQNFRKCKGQISNDVTDVELYFSDSQYNGGVDFKMADRFYDKLEVLKSSFPQLTNVLASSGIRSKGELFELFMLRDFKSTLAFFSSMVYKKPDWCTSLKYLFNVRVVSMTPQQMSRNELKELFEKVMKLYRSELHFLKHLRFYGPEQNQWEETKNFHAFAFIEFENDRGIPCQVAFSMVQGQMR